MHISEDGPTLNGNSYYASISAPKSKHLVNENSMQFNNCWNQFNQTKRQCKSAKSVIVPRFSNSDVSLYSNQNEICKPSIATKSTYCDKENFIRGYKRPCINNIGCHKCQSKKCIYSKNVQLYYVFDKPFHREKEPQIAQESINKSTAFSQVDNLTGLNDENKRLKQLVNAFAESVECKCIANKLKQLIPHSHEPTPQSARVEAETRAVQCKCKCVANKLKQFIPRSNEFKPQYALATERIISDFNYPRENIAQTSTRCRADCIKNEQENFKRLFRRLIKAPTTSGIYVEANTQSPCYEGSYQRAGRTSFYREVMTSGTPNKQKYSELQENPREEVNNEPSVIGCNGGYITKCSKDTTFKHTSQSTRTLAQDDINKKKGVFTVFCNMMLQPTNVFPLSKKCCKNRGTICQVSDDNEGGVLKKLSELLIEPKNINHTASSFRKSRGALCNVDGDRDEDSAIKKLYQGLLDPKSYKNKVKPCITGAEVMTQSRSYGGRQQRAGREIFCKNRGTFGAPNFRHPNVEREGYEEVIEELPTCLKNQPDTNKEFGIGTKCKFSLDWFKDRHVYGEPKPHCDFKGTIPENPRKEVNYEPSGDAFYGSYKPVTVDRRIGCNDRCITKCSKDTSLKHTSQCARKVAQKSTNYHLDDINKEKGIFTVFCNMVLQPTNLFPVSKKCCKNRGTICQISDDNEGGVLKKFCELLIEPKNINNTASQCRKSRGALCNVDGDRDEDSAIKKLYQGLLDPKGCKNKVKPCITGAEVMTQSRSYGGRQQRAGREIFCKNRGTFGAPNFRHPNIEREGYEEVIEELPTCLKNQPDTDKEFGIGTNCKFSLGWFKDRHVYGEPKPHCDFKGTIPENPRKEVNYEPSGDAFYGSYKPVMVDRRIGCNGGYITKCSKDVSLKHTSQCARKLAQTSTNCHLDDINKEKGVFTVFCNMMLQPTNLLPVSKKCCKNRGTICQMSDDNEGGVLKKLCELLIEPKNINHTASPCRKSRGALCNVDGDRDEDSAIKKLYQGLLDPKDCKNKVKPCITGAEVMTQSRSYGERQQRAGREIFCKNRGTSGAPKFRPPNIEKEEYEDVIEELPTCLEIQPDSNKEIGIGTNCKFSLGWYKDRHAYGEPKPRCDFKGAKQKWNEVPLRQTGTKLGASLKTDSHINFYNTNAATQSRKCRSRHLRAGRETFYKEAQTSCVPKNTKNKVEGNYNVSNQPMQCAANDRKAIRFGSDCSFSFEISKDRNTENPDKSKPCGDKIDENQTKNPFYSKLIGHWRSQQGNEQKAGETGKSDAITSTHVCDDECQCKNLHDKTCERRPLHIGSKVSYDFNFSKSIFPPKPTSLVAQEPCIKSSKQVRTTKCDAALSAECVPDRNNYDSLNTSNRVTKRIDYSDPIHIKRDNNKTGKECFLELLELVSKKNFLRLIKGDQNPEKQIVKEKAELGSLKIPKIEVPQIVCPGKCNSKCQPAEKSDQPFRVESSFSFDYNMRNATPKHEKTYEESFPRIEDFSGSVKKLNLFRLIIGKVRKRIKKPVVSTACDPVECRLRKQRHSPWFTYILDNIKQARQVSEIKKEESEVKDFFSDLLHKPSFCFRGKLRRDSRYLYLMSNLREQLKETRPGDKKSTNSIISHARLLLARSRDHPRRRRRRRRGRGKIIPKWYEQDIDTLSSSILPSSRMSRTSDEDCKPCQIASDCCFKCDYKKSDNSDNETQSSKSTISSMKYATT